MKSETITIDNTGSGFTEALKQVENIGTSNELSHKNQIHLLLLTEEMLSLARSITGEMKASFWIENEGSYYELHMTTKTIMDAEKRFLLIEQFSNKSVILSVKNCKYNAIQPGQRNSAGCL